MLRILSFPFIAAGTLISFILGALGRFVAFFIGFAIAAVGVVLCLSVVGLILGIPMVVFGGGLMMRSIF